MAVRTGTRVFMSAFNSVIDTDHTTPLQKAYFQNLPRECAVLPLSASNPKPSKGRPLKAICWAREKSSSCGTLTTFLTPKRKRESDNYIENLNSSSLLLEDLPSAVPTSSPPSKRVNASSCHNIDQFNCQIEGDMEEQLQEVRNVLLEKLDDIKLVFSSQLENFKKEVCSDITSLKEEFTKFKTESIEKETRTNDRFALFEASLNSLKSSFERLDSQHRRNNVIVKGLKFNEASSDLLSEVNSFFLQKFGIENAVLEAFPLGPAKSWLLVKFLNFATKQKIMSKKASTLRGSPISIDNDLIDRERNIMALARRRLRSEREKGRNTKLGFLKICINGNWLSWSDTAQDFVDTPAGQNLASQFAQSSSTSPTLHGTRLLAPSKNGRL